MAGMVATGPVLSDSALKTRPGFGVYFRSDTNSSDNSVRQIETRRQSRQRKFPNLSRRHDVDSFQKPLSPGFKKFNDEGEFRVEAPFRDYDNVTDPVSGFLSAGADLDRRTGVSKIRSFVQIATEPQNRAPQSINSIRIGQKAAPPETRRVTEKDPPGPGKWNERLYTYDRMRAELGGWTSDEDPRANKPQVPISSVFPEFKRSKTAPELNIRDSLALKYIYTSATQKSYEDIPYDNYLRPKKWTKPTTLEREADPVSRKYVKRYLPAAGEWQTVGRSWDGVQTRPDHFNQPRPYTFTTRFPRAQQIPCYSGMIGGENALEIDNPSASFTPFTVKRNVQPSYSETAARPNIPGYMGCVFYQPQSKHAHADEPQPMPQTTGRVHKELPVVPNESEHKHEAPMSKMVTTVPPCNPFNKVQQPEIVAK